MVDEARALVDGQRGLGDIEAEAVQGDVELGVAGLGVASDRRRRLAQASEIRVELGAGALPLRGDLRAGALRPGVGARDRRRGRLRAASAAGKRQRECSYDRPTQRRARTPG
jgi:hypothetical protein